MQPIVPEAKTVIASINSYTLESETPSSTSQVCQKHTPKLVARWVLEEGRLVCKWSTVSA